MAGRSDMEIEVVYEDGVFKPLKEVSLSEGTRAFVTLRSGKVLEVTRRHRMRVDTDVMEEFIEERR